MTEGTHQPLTIEEVRTFLALLPEEPFERALRMLEAAWEATEPGKAYNYPSERYEVCKAGVRRAIFGRTEETG